jgi:hypothetical protein
MSTPEQMTIDERYKYLRLMQPRYFKAASRQERSALLDEMEQVTGLHRKSLIRLLRGNLTRKKRRKQRGRVYGAQVDDALRVIAESMDYICAERLTPNLVWLAEHLAAHGELVATPELLAKLETISLSTVRRILRRIRQDEPRLPRKGPTSANRVAREVPMAKIPWHEAQPGHLEIDLVHHCGPSTEGEYAHTLQMIDVATGWSERVAVLGRSYRVMADAFRYIQQRLPFPILELHCDNGSEFLNQHLVRFWKNQVPDIHLTRSRPYFKNDNRFVEQKNDTLVRAYFGHQRLDSVAQVLAMNEVYEHMWLYYNLFQPVMRLADKVVVSENGRPTRVKRVFDQARTPFDRLCATETIPPDQRAALQAWRQEINPRALRRKIYAALEQLFRLPGAVLGQTESIYDTLFFPEAYDLD